MSTLSLNDCQYRDYYLIMTYFNECKRTGKPVSDIIIKLTSQKPIFNVSSHVYEVDAPLILMEGERVENSIEEFFFDSSINSGLFTNHFYLKKLFGFIFLLLSDKQDDGGVAYHSYALSLLHRAVQKCRSDYGISESKRFVQRLHDNRWSLGSEMTENLLNIAFGVNNKDEFVINANNDEFLKEYISSVRNKLNYIKENSKTLTEWNEGVYSVNPDVINLMRFLNYSNHDEHKKWSRFFAEVDADITASTIRSTFTTFEDFIKIEQHNGWLSFFLMLREDSSTLSDFKTKLKYLLNSRMSIPKFWMDLAVENYDTPQNKLPYILYKVDFFNSISIDIINSIFTRSSEKS